MKRNHNFYFLFAFCIICAVTSKAQSIISFTSDQGLSSTCVRGIYEDSRKNIWISTRNGLNRFDGAKINTYHHVDGDPTSLCNDLITYVLEYDKDHILIGGEKGVQSYNYDTDSFEDVPLLINNRDTMTVHVVSMAKLRNGEINVCVATNGSFLIKKNNQGKLYGQYTDKYLFNGSRPTHVYQPGEHTWVVTHKHEVMFYDGKSARKIPGIKNVLRLCVGLGGDTYAATVSDGLYKYSKEDHVFIRVDTGDALLNKVVKNIKSDKNGHLLICTDGGGLLVYDESTGSITQSSIKTPEYDFTKSNVEDAMLDSDGNLWVGVYWKGVVVQPRLTNAFEYVGRRSGTKNTIGTNCITALLPASDGGVWVAADHQGLFLMHNGGLSSTHWGPDTTPGVPATIGSIYEDTRNGILWLGSSIGGVSCMRTSDNTFMPLSSYIPGGEQVHHVFDMKADQNGNVWVASMGEGVFRVNINEKIIENYHSDVSRSKQYGILVNPWVSCLAVYSGRLYVGTADGIDIFNIKKDGSLLHDKTILRTVSISAIRFAADGTMWVASSNGVYMQDKSGSLINYTTKDGLPDNHACSLELSPRGVQQAVGTSKYTVWISTDNGMCLFDPDLKKFETYTIADGLQGNEFSNGASAIRGGILYFGGINGLNYFTPADIEKGYATVNLSFRIVDLYLFNKSVKVGQKSGSYDIIDTWISEASEVNFCCDDNSFTLELSTMSLTTNGHVSYEYSVNGNEWINLGVGNSKIVFSNVTPGTYNLKIRAVGYNQVSEERHITIYVHSPWYTSTLAYIIYTILVLGILYFIIAQLRARHKARRILERHRQEESLNEARIQFFMNISHEIRTPMTLIMAPLEKLKAMGDDEEHQRNYRLINQNAHRILRLINQLMDIRKIEKGQFQLDYKRVEMVGFLRNLYDVFASTAQTRNIKFSFVHEGIDNLESYADPSSLDKIVMNLLSNAFKFTPDGGYIVIDLKIITPSAEDSNDERALLNADGVKMQISVTDSGVGIPDEEKNKVFKRFYSAKHQNGYIGTGIGLNLTALLVDLHKGIIEVDDNPMSRGARFTVTLPVGSPSSVVESDTDSYDDYEEVTHDDLPLETAKEAASTTPASKRFNMLLVEDDVPIRHYISSELASDFNISECDNGKEAWDYVQRNPDKVDIVVSDIMMPIMEGTDLCRNIKTNFTTNHIPIILMSAKSTDADRIEGLEIGADAYITKPFNVEILRTQAMSIIRQRKMLKGKHTTEMQREEKIDKIEMQSPDEHLMNRVMKVMNENLDNPEVSVEFLADKVGVSRVHFHRKIKELAGQTPRDFVKSIRLSEAARLLREKHFDISEVSTAVGFKSLSTFSTSFKQVYGMSPSEYMAANKNQ